MKKIIKALIPALSLMMFNAQGSESIVIQKKKLNENQPVTISRVVQAEQFNHETLGDGTHTFTATNLTRTAGDRSFDVSLDYKIEGSVVNINKLTLLDAGSKKTVVELSGRIPRNAINSDSSPIGLILAADKLSIKTTGETDLSNSWVKLGLYDLLPENKSLVVHERIHLNKENNRIEVAELFFSVDNVFDFHFSGTLIHNNHTWMIKQGTLTTNIFASGKLSELVNNTLVNTKGHPKTLYNINFLAIFSKDLNNEN